MVGSYSSLTIYLDFRKVFEKDFNANSNRLEYRKICSKSRLNCYDSDQFGLTTRIVAKSTDIYQSKTYYTRILNAGFREEILINYCYGSALKLAIEQASFN